MVKDTPPQGKPFCLPIPDEPLLSEGFVSCCVSALLDSLKDGHTDKFVGSSTEYWGYECISSNCLQ